jgi:hypothetical protein
VALVHALDQLDRVERGEVGVVVHPHTLAHGVVRRVVAVAVSRLP